MSSRLRDSALFYRQLATSLDAGLSADQSLGVLARDAGRVGHRAREAQRLVEQEGMDLGEAVAAGERDPVLGPARASMLRNAWATGSFVEALRSLGEESEERLRHRRRLRSSLLRPFLLVLLVPLILSVPALVRGGPSAYLAAALPGLLGVGLVLLLAVVIARAGPALPRAVPLLGPLGRERACARACEALGYFFEGGAPPGPALREAARAAGPGPEGEALRAASRRVERGASLEEALGRDALPGPLRSYLATGESSGTLARMARVAARHHADEALRRFRRLARVLVGCAFVLAFAWAGWKIVGGFLSYFSVVEEAIP